MAQETTMTTTHEQEMLNDITRILTELISSARGASKPIESIPIKFTSNSCWHTWDIIAWMGNYRPTYRISQRTCGCEAVRTAIHKFNASRGDIDISDIDDSQEGDSWMFNIRTSKES